MKTEKEHSNYGIVKESVCCTCGHKLNDCTAVNGPNAKPRYGDISVCLNCGEIFVFEHDLSVRPAELNDLMKLGKVERRVVDQVQRIIRKRGRL
jgi:hypothetical protein